MITFIVAVLLVAGIGGTAALSDNARPGDVLFGVDRAVENVRINLAGKEDKNELRLRFAEERVKEVRELEEESEEAGDEAESPEAEEETEAEITAGIEFALDLLTDLDETMETDDARLGSLADELSGYLEGLPEGARVQVSDDRLRIKFEGGPEKIEIKEQGEDKAKIDVRTEEGRFRIEVKDGAIEIKTKLEKAEDDDSSEEADTDIEAEAKILSDKTIIEVEIGDEKTTFATSANTREGIIEAILVKFPNLSAEQVGAVLKIETEDGDEGEDLSGDDVDEGDDLDEDNGDDVEDDNSGEDEDNDDNEGSDDNNEDADEDNSGSNSGSGQ